MQGPAGAGGESQLRQPIRQMRFGLIALVSAVLLLATATLTAQRALPSRLQVEAFEPVRPAVLDRTGEPLSSHYQQRWNTADRLSLAQVPAFLKTAIVVAEDHRYWQHSGIDWRARLAALWQFARAGRAVRGASTISEQVVRLLHPRTRTIWARWVEGFEADAPGSALFEGSDP